MNNNSKFHTVTLCYDITLALAAMLYKLYKQITDGTTLQCFYTSSLYCIESWGSACESCEQFL